MRSTPIDLDEARDLLKRAVETQGRKFIYNPDGAGVCRYTPSDCPPSDPRSRTGCLIGVALDLAGETRHHGVQASVREFLHKFPDMLTERAATYFLVAQVKQDLGTSWGYAFDAAEEFARAEGWVE